MSTLDCLMILNFRRLDVVKQLTIIVQKSLAEEACKLFSILGGQYGLIVIISSGAEEEGKPFNMSLPVERF